MVRARRLGVAPQIGRVGGVQRSRKHKFRPARTAQVELQLDSGVLRTLCGPFFIALSSICSEWKKGVSHAV